MLIGHTLEARGYGSSHYTQQKPYSDIAGNPVTEVAIDDNTVTLLGHTNIDIGGFGKGWMIDKLTTIFKEQFGLEQFLINGGGDMYATHHNGQSIEIFLEDPTKTNTILARTTIKNQGFASSSPHKRTWHTTAGDTGTKQHTHIVSDVLQLKDATYITANTAVDADVFATTFLQLDHQAMHKMANREKITILL